MAIIARERGKDFKPAPEGLHVGVCVDVVDLGIVDTNFGKKPMVKFVWQIDEENEETKAPFQVSRRYGLTLDKRAALRKDLESWRGRKFTKEELESFDLEKVLGAPCQIQVVHNVTDDAGTYANVQVVLPLAKGQAKLAPVGYTREKDRPQDGATGTPKGVTKGSAVEETEEVPF